MEVHELWKRAVAGDTYSIARCARRIDDRDAAMCALLPSLYEGRRGAHLIGLTGNPGAGKSTLTAELVKVFRENGDKVAVIAVDPTSPFSGGAILGDRIRMQAHYGDPGVFIRSVATRGVLGGISHSTRDLIAMFDALGFERVIVETVGVGQDEVDIAFTVDTNLVVCLPEAGDGVQMIKAGLMETADIFVLNKADLFGADKAHRQLEQLVSIAKPRSDGWVVAVCSTIAQSGSGVVDLVNVMDGHRRHLNAQPTGAYSVLKKRRWIEELVLSRLQSKARRLLDGYEMEDGENPYLAAEALLRDLETQ